MSANSLHWDDLRTILAIARSGSLAGGARELGVNHATAFRRLADIERRLGVRLFDRASGGYTPTLAGDDIAAAAERVETEVLGVERRLVGQDFRPAGTVRVTTTDSLLVGLLSPIFAAFRDAYPEIALEVTVSNELFSLPRREADVAIRPTFTPPGTLIGRKIGTIAHAVYGRVDGGHVWESRRALSDAAWVGPDERLPFPALASWMAKQRFDACCGYRTDTVMGMLAAVQGGIGLAALPCYLCMDDDRLARLSEPIPELATDLWLLTHPDLRRAARIRALLNCISPLITSALEAK